MLQKRKQKPTKSRPVGNISFHFKDLSDTEIEGEKVEPIETGLNQEGPPSASGVPLVQSIGLDINLNTVFQSPLDPLMQIPAKSAKFSGISMSEQDPSLTTGPFSYSPGGSQYTKPHRPAPPRPTKPPNLNFSTHAIEKSMLSKKKKSHLQRPDLFEEPPANQERDTATHSREATKCITSMQCDADHPLVSLQSDDEESDDETYHTDISQQKLREDTTKIHPETVTKEMISSALFDPKARTQLFSTLRKNIQHYTNSGSKIVSESAPSKSLQYAEYSGSDFDTMGEDMMEYKTRTSLQSSDFLHQQGLKYGAQSVKSEPELRKRSSSENSITGSHQRKNLNLNLDEKTLTMEPQRSASQAISLSSLLAERQKSIVKDATSLESNGDSIKQEKIKTEEPKFMEDQLLHKDSNLLNIKGLPASPKKKSSPVPGSSLPSIYLLYFFSFSVFLYFVLPLPLSVHIIISAFVLGVIFSTLALCILTPGKQESIVVKPPYVSQPVPFRIPKSVFNPTQAFKGWMNEIEIYNLDTYHVSATRSVFVTLEGNTLRLQTPHRNIPRRAVFGEGNIQVSNVVHQRIWDVSKAKVYLVPDGLVKKRIWSKKYPIYIEFLPEKNANVHKSKENGKSNLNTVKSNDAYDIISDDDLTEKIYLFGRTQRQKEEWFYRFQRAITLAQKNILSKLDTSPSPGEGTILDADDMEVEHQEIKSMQNEMKPLDKRQSNLTDPLLTYQDYYTSMCRLLPDPAVYTTVRSGSSAQELNKITVNIDQSRAVHFSTAASQDDTVSEVVMSQPRQIVRSPSHHSGEPGLEVAWFNVVVGRIMFDFLRRPKWANWLSTKIQKKLEKIRLPYFMEGLKLTEMDLGTTIPLVHKISLPRLDSKGIWLDMDVTYNGAVQMTLETKMVLTKLGKQNIVSSVDKNKLGNKSAITNSDEEDSAESSDDEESSFASPLPSSLQHLIPSGSENSPPFRHRDKHQRTKSSSGNHPPSSGSVTPQQEKRWVRIMDSITKSKYFQKATENSYIRKKLETVSNTPLILMAELHQCQGTLCVNIPPPPSDRIWYGFKDHPHMVLRAHPKLGERAVTTTTITDWIEKKLVQEFNKVLLMPNMDDIPIPLMFNNLPNSS